MGNIKCAPHVCWSHVRHSSHKCVTHTVSTDSNDTTTQRQSNTATLSPTRVNRKYCNTRTKAREYNVACNNFTFFACFYAVLLIPSHVKADILRKRTPLTKEWKRVCGKHCMCMFAEKFTCLVDKKKMKLRIFTFQPTERRKKYDSD